MSTRIYTLPVEQTQWHIEGDATTVFNWEYDESRDRLLTLYEKGKEKQWNTNTRLDWSIEVDPGSPENAPDYYIPIYGSDIYEKMTDKEGRASWTPKEGNYYLVVAHWQESKEAGKDYQSTKYSATLTVLVPQVCPCCGD